MQIVRHSPKSPDNLIAFFAFYFAKEEQVNKKLLIGSVVILGEP
jgi:hypothetical protein